MPAGPNQRVHFDLYGPFKTSESGNKYVLVYTDAFTKMARVSATGDKLAPTVEQAILDIMYTFGVPRQIHSDQGLEFCNQLMQIICDKLNINRTTTTPYHPQCNAAAERFNRTMGQYLRKAIHDSKSSCYRFLGIFTGKNPEQLCPKYCWLKLWFFHNPAFHI